MSPPVLRKFSSAAIAVFLLWLCLRYLTPIVLPFILAVLLALAAEPLVRIFHRRLHLPRAVATGIGVSVCLSLMLLGIFLLLHLLLRQLRGLAGIVPDLEQTALRGLDSAQQLLTELARTAPESLRPVLQRSVEHLFSNGTAVIDRISAWLLGLATDVVSRLPDSLLGFGTWLLASFMLSAKLPGIQSWLLSRLPQRWSQTWLPALKRLKRSVLGWLLAQCKLIGVTFCVLTAGLLILRIPHAPLWAGLISLVDALPILGTGMVLLPWSFVSLLQGNSMRALGLLGVYAIAALLRSVLEPRFVGRQLGLDPLVTLFSMYAGYQLFGLAGMILSPLLAVTVTQLFTAPKEG